MESDKPLSIEAVIEGYSSYVYNLALRLSANPHKAEDLAQETFIKAWMHIAGIREDGAIKKWLRVVCINEYRMMLRKEKQEIISMASVEELEENGMLLMDLRPLPLTEVEVEEEVTRLRNGCFLAMTRRLTLNQRIAFSLIDMFGLSIGETAELLDLTPKAVKGLLYRARMNLESFFQGHCMFLDIQNPCKCAAWIEFMKDRNAFQDKMRQKLTHLNYKKTGYVHNPETSRKILDYYRNLPEQRPGREWYEKMIEIIGNLS